VIGGTAQATLPPPGLPGLDPSWSRLVVVPDLDGGGRTFHVLDNGVTHPEITVLCVHGNPSWSYLWRSVLASAPAGVRVIAPDHLDMGFSERTGTSRRLQDRIDDLCALTDELDLSGPVVTVAHDWGGPISLGWAEQHRDQLAGIVLANTAVHQPAGSPAPRLIRAARLPGVLEQVTVRTPMFIRGALEMSNPRPSAAVRAAYHAPYLTPERRGAIGTFVADIPLDDAHPSHEALQRVAAGLADLQDVPVLLLWGPSDPVFSDIYLHDLEARLPQADVHRFIGARHYTPEDADVAGAVHTWVGELGAAELEPVPTEQRQPLWAALEQRRDDPEVAVVEMVGDGVGRSVTFAELALDVETVAKGLGEAGVQPGDRVALLIPPGIELTVCLYACWRLGAVVVVADAGLGLGGMGRALASAAPAYLIGIPRALAAARALRWPGVRIAAAPLSEVARRSLGALATIDEIRALGSVGTLPAAPSDDSVAAVVFTSGATGSAKGVVYRHHQAQAQRDALMQIYGIAPDDRLVAAFGPFALYGPAMGICSAVPEMEVTSPGTLTADALGAAVAAIDATLVFASPAALSNVSATADGLPPPLRGALAGVRLLMSAGAPVSPAVLRRARRVMPNAEAHTPYGMTEVLPVADITLEEIEAAGEGNGVCVGLPAPGVEVMIDPLDDLGRPQHEPVTTPDVSGEVCIRAPHVKDRYDRLWVTQQASAQPPGWHRSGDVGHLDAQGRLWIEGRLFHVIAGPEGPITPVAIEHAVESIESIALAAAVGVGPRGTQQVVVVAAPNDPPRRPGLASDDLSDAVRAVVDVEVAAVLIVPALPVDKRHNSKIDRTRVARWAEQVLAGGRIGRL
jgi:acyl-coenzyme A synthetase/AMP-(fatty) acid ligase/pimeloyl-ACP methyl ester carboxylesterase